MRFFDPKLARKMDDSAEVGVSGERHSLDNEEGMVSAIARAAYARRVAVPRRHNFLLIMLGCQLTAGLLLRLPYSVQRPRV